MTRDRRYPPDGRDGLSGSVRSTGSGGAVGNRPKILVMKANGKELAREDITGKTHFEISDIEETLRNTAPNLDVRFVVEDGDEG